MDSPTDKMSDSPVSNSPVTTSWSVNNDADNSERNKQYSEMLIRNAREGKSAFKIVNSVVK